MDEHLQFDPARLADGAKLRQPELTGQIQPAHTLPRPKTDAGDVSDIGLGRQMERQFRHQPGGEVKHTGVGNDQPVSADVTEKEEVGGQPVQVTVVGENVDRDIDLDPVVVGVVDGPAQLLVCKVGGAGTQSVGFAAEIDRIGTIVDGCGQFFKAASWGQQFGKKPRTAAHGLAITH